MYTSQQEQEVRRGGWGDVNRPHGWQLARFSAQCSARECVLSAPAAPAKTKPKTHTTHDTHAQVLKDAVEMAVLSSVNHPNIVQLYACLTDMVEVSTGGRRGGGGCACGGCLGLAAGG